MDEEAQRQAQAPIHCPVCEQDISADAFLLHSMMQHPQFFAVWATFSMPTFVPNYEALYDAIHTDWIDEDDNMEYEELLALCETIGYHKEGVANVEEVAPIIEKNKVENANEWKCTICLECIADIEHTRRIRTCGHTFCAECLETWLKENKKCPVCKQEVIATVDELD